MSDMSEHVLAEVRTLRAEINSALREQRVVVDKLKDRQHIELNAIYAKISELNLAMNNRNKDRESEHKALAQRVSLFSGGVSLIVSGAVAAAFTFLKDFFFP